MTSDKLSFRAIDRTCLRAARGQVAFAVQALQGELVIHDRDNDVADVRAGRFFHDDNIAEVEREFLLFFESPPERRGRFEGEPSLPRKSHERLIAGDEHVGLSLLGEN